jgi:hypothetical protein
MQEEIVEMLQIVNPTQMSIILFSFNIEHVLFHENHLDH